MGNFIIQDQWENQEKRWTSSRGIRYRSWEFKNGGDEQKREKNGSVF